MPNPNGVAYKVKSGDSLWSIAHAHYGHGAVWPSIFAFNQQSGIKERVKPRLLHPDEIQAGQTIYLPRRLLVQDFKRQPGQRHTPGRIGPTRPAGGAHQPTVPNAHPRAPTQRAPNPMPSTSPTPTPGHNQDNGNTIVNTFGVKIDTSQFHKFKREFNIGAFTVEVEFKGTIVVRHDKTMPVATFSKDNYEYTYKNEMLNTAGALTDVTKFTVDWKKKSGSVETLFSTNLITGNKAPISLGSGVDEKGPYLRGKIDYKGVHGVIHRILYFVQDDETLTVQVTVRPKVLPKPTDPEGPPGVPVGVPVTAPRPVPLPVPNPIPVPGPDVLPAPPEPHPNHDLQPTVSPTLQHSENILQQAGKLAHDHPVAAVVVGVAVVGLVILALPEEAVGGAVAAVGAAGRWLLLRAAPAALAGAGA